MISFMIYYWCSGTVTTTNWAVAMTPLLILQLMLLSLGFGVMISALTTKYRDMKMLIGFGLQLWQYASPVAYDMYSMEAFAPGGALHTLYMLNPVTPIINIFRYGFLGVGSIEWGFYGISWIVTILVCTLGIVLFSRVEKTFMDTV